MVAEGTLTSSVSEVGFADCQCSLPAWWSLLRLDDVSRLLPTHQRPKLCRSMRLVLEFRWRRVES